MPTVADLIDYLNQFDPTTQVYRSEDAAEKDLDNRDGFITLAAIPLEEWEPLNPPDVDA